MPALTVVMSVNPTQMTPNQQGAVCQLVITNTGTTPAIITSIQPTLSSGTAPLNMGVPAYGQGLLTSVPANSSVQTSWGIAPYGLSNKYQGGAPGPSYNNFTDTNPANVDTTTYTVGANVQTSDGIVSVAQTQQIQLIYATNSLPVLPLNGQLRFDSSGDSGLIGLL
jgi:hypothetical protein